MDWFELSYKVLGGLGLFFYGMMILSESLQAIAGTLIRKIIGLLTSNRFVAVMVGLVVTSIVQSSSVTTVMVIGFVNAGLMSLTQAIGVIFGANIGTTITGWIIAIKIGKYSLLLLGVGIFPILFSSNERVKEWGKVIFALGLVFLGLGTMSGAFKPLRTHQEFLSFMTMFSADSYLSLLAAIGIGCALTFVIQSSSAMLGITIALATSGAISFQTAVALVMGENIGTTITALLASIGANIEAKRAAYAHALFNVLGVFVLTFVFWRYVDALEYFIAGDADFILEDGTKPFIAAHIAAGHTFFNVVNVVIFLPLLGVLAKVVTKLAPDKGIKEPKHLQFFGPAGTLSPGIAIELASQEVKKMAGIVEKALLLTKEHLLSAGYDKEREKKILKYENITDHIQMEVMVFLEKVMGTHLSHDQASSVKSLMRMSDELESIADNCETVARLYKRIKKNNLEIGEKTTTEIDRLMDNCITIFDLLFKAIKKGERGDLPDLTKELNAFNKAAHSIRDLSIQQVADKQMSGLANLAITDIIACLRRIKSHSTNVLDAYRGHKHAWSEV